jgi:hypothetical protein
VQKNRPINTAALYAALIVVSVMALPSFAQEATGGEDESALAKKSQNPLANMISLPLQNNTTFNVGPAQAVVGEFLQSFKEYPQRQPIGSFSLDRVMETINSAGKK